MLAIKVRTPQVIILTQLRYHQFSVLRLLSCAQRLFSHLHQRRSPKTRLPSLAQGLVTELLSVSLLLRSHRCSSDKSICHGPCGWLLNHKLLSLIHFHLTCFSTPSINIVTRNEHLLECCRRSSETVSWVVTISWSLPFFNSLSGYVNIWPKILECLVLAVTMNLLIDFILRDAASQLPIALLGGPIKY